MASNVPDHLGENHEATDELISIAEGLLFSLHTLVDDVNRSPKHQNAVYVLLNTIAATFDKLGRTRQMEWVGIGGRSEALTPEEIAKARGETAQK